MSGNTKYVADKIAERIEADMIRIDSVKAYPDKGTKKFSNEEIKDIRDYLYLIADIELSLVNVKMI